MTLKDIHDFQKKFNDLCEMYGISDGVLFVCLDGHNHLLTIMNCPFRECELVQTIKANILTGVLSQDPAEVVNPN